MASYDDSHFGVLPIFEREETNPVAPTPSKTTQGQTSSHKKISVVWEDFERIFVDGVWKVKYKKYAKFYSCANNRRTGHLRRYQKSHRMSDSHLQSTLNVQEGSLVDKFVYNHEN